MIILNTKRNFLVGASLALVACGFSSTVHAQTVGTTAMNPSQISALKSELAQLEAQLAALEGTSAQASTGTDTSMSMMSATGTAGVSSMFPLYLFPGSTGSEVVQLQDWLMSNGYPITDGATGYFGAQTQAALAAYQSAHGIYPANGYFGPVTRAQIIGTPVTNYAGPTSMGAGTTSTSASLDSEMSALDTKVSGLDGDLSESDAVSNTSDTAE
jgi:hypothetical protein